MEVVPEVPSGIASSHVCTQDCAKATGTSRALMEQEKTPQNSISAAILSPHRQLQIAHMASVSELCL